MKKTYHPKWRIVEAALNSLELQTRSGKKMCELVSEENETTPEMWTTARRIVTAVNNFDELLDAAKDVLNQYDASIMRCGPDLSDSIRIFLRNAVAKSEGTTVKKIFEKKRWGVRSVKRDSGSGSSSGSRHGHLDGYRPELLTGRCIVKLNDYNGTVSSSRPINVPTM